ncbi:MAG: carboxymuconolactone decarboxylase family protein [Methyloligellaceae bacterium]
MTAMNCIDPKTATGDTKEAYDEATRQFGGVINLFQIAGNAPNVLKGILALNKSVNRESELTGKQVELVAMLVSALNRCDYCVNVHMQVGKGQGLSESELLEAMAGTSRNAADQSLLNYTNEVVRNRGMVSSNTFEAARSAGFSDKALLEVIGVIGLYTTLQYIRHVGNPDHDFPIVDKFDPIKHGADDGTAYKTA